MPRKTPVAGQVAARKWPRFPNSGAISQKVALSAPEGHFPEKRRHFFPESGTFFPAAWLPGKRGRFPPKCAPFFGKVGYRSEVSLPRKITSAPANSITPQRRNSVTAASASGLSSRTTCPAFSTSFNVALGSSLIHFSLRRYGVSLSAFDQTSSVGMVTR